MVQNKSRKPKISVVMPVYNAEKYLDESIKSILNQTFKEFELIIINDASTDSSLKIIKKFQKKDKRVKLIKNKKNLGPAKARNKALKLAKGKYIAILDSDDICFPDRFKIQCDYLEDNPHIFLVGSSAIVIDEKGEKIGIFKKYDNYKKIKKKLTKTNCMIHPSIMFKNAGDIFYRKKFQGSEDYDLYLRLLTSEKNLTNLQDILLKYRISENSFVSTMPNQMFYFNKAKEFYSQRLQHGKDDYENLSPPLKDLKIPDFDKSNLNTKILSEFQDNQMKQTRKDIKKYFKEYGFEKRMALYYILSFFPSKVIYFLQRNF
ncbi:glycosyltransferase family 2 protein [Candidatus Pacearchaeota archaeon]|nr:glycosyltransferase family 2 protein [Candidatus Pacearchaeota archaeon]